jgi:simple sugar transport system ATP-binding protein
VRLVLDQVATAASAATGQPLQRVSLTLRAGEILGIAGVSGNGQGALNDVLNGELVPSQGRVLLDGTDLSQCTTRQRAALGLSVLPAERRGRGAVGSMSLVDNLLLTGTDVFRGRWGLLDRDRATRQTQSIIDDYQISAGGPESAAQSLSGGNLQKLLLGRALWQNPAVLVCNHPTWGVDIGAAAAIHTRLIGLRDAGAALLLLSEDLDEIFLLADRIGALCGGRLSPVLPKPEVTLTQLGLWMTQAAEGSVTPPHDGIDTQPDSRPAGEAGP